MHCVLTGGEPCSQDILLLTRRLLEAGLAVQLETSGTEALRCIGGSLLDARILREAEVVV